jgi:hypothetical protein
MTDSLTAHSGSETEQFAESLKQWKIYHPDGPGAEVRSGKQYLLKNSTNRHFLRYKEQLFCAINLGFTDDAEPATAAKSVQWAFVTRDGGGPVRYDEPVAIRCRDGYLYYGSRDCGINLKWSKTPVFEWRLLGGRPGTRVRTQDWLSIFNEHSENGKPVVREPLIYFRREFGGNIGWPSSKTLLGHLGEWAEDAVKEAVVQYLKSQTGGK